LENQVVTGFSSDKFSLENHFRFSKPTEASLKPA